MTDAGIGKAFDGHGTQAVAVHWRYLGSTPGSWSGCRRIIFTFQNMTIAEQAQVLLSRWWWEDETLERGYRFCKVRWMQPPPPGR